MQVWTFSERYLFLRRGCHMAASIGGLSSGDDFFDVPTFSKMALTPSRQKHCSGIFGLLGIADLTRISHTRSVAGVLE